MAEIRGVGLLHLDDEVMAFARGAVDVIDGAFPLRVRRQHLLVVKIYLRNNHLSFEEGIEESH